jgi:LmbE family N-acetylglucosaminyl deacetylase
LVYEGDTMKQRRSLRFLICSLFCFVFIIMNTINIEAMKKKEVESTHGNNVNKIIDLYYIPHPDDETLSMGVAIADSVYNGNEVHLILLSNGKDSNTRDQINGVKFCRLHNKYHVPSIEGYKPLTMKMFGRLRVKEFINAAIALGVQKKNIDICNFNDSKFKEEDISRIALKYAKSYPNSRCNTTSYYDNHRSHKKIAITLYGLYKQDKIKVVRFFISPSKWGDIKGIVISNPKLKDIIIKSISNYSIWNPQESLYAIGYHSVGYLFEMVKKQLVSKYHSPSKQAL